MNLAKKCVFLVVLSTLIEFMKVANDERVCPAGHYLIVDEKGLTKCQLCPNCPPGFGLEPLCGSTLIKTESLDIDCKPCVRGKTYSEEHGPGSCKSCAICAPKEVVLNKCTEEKNANCSGTCVKNYYFDSRTHDCQPCSYCCGDKNDVIVKECVDHGMPKHRRCNILRRLQCTPQNATTTPIQHEKKEPNNLKVILGVIFGSLVFTAIVIFADILWYRRCYRQSNIKECEMEMMKSAENNVCESCDALSKIKIKKIDFGYIKLSTIKKEAVFIGCFLMDEQNEEILNDNCVYTWFKDDRKEENEHSNLLAIENDITDIFDFDHLKCQIECIYHAGGNIEVFLDAKPGPGNSYTRLILSSLPKDVFDVVVRKLAEVGLWKEVAEKYGLSDTEIKELEGKDPDTVAKATLKAVQCTHPELTVNEFCKFMKELKISQHHIEEHLEPFLPHSVET